MITITVSGPAGSGKSAVAQTLSMLLQQLDLNVTTELGTDLRSVEALEQIVASLSAHKISINIAEAQTPHRTQANSTKKESDDE